ncbi:MAG: hypothetical protein HYW48_05510 [Deltaproteobacteria bacterium]|nr:hypothetical protein [Deltaproteobacteria bacterium]
MGTSFLRKMSCSLGLLCLFNTSIRAENGEPRQEPAKHKFGLGLSSVIFTKDLKELFGNTLSPSLSYRYALGAERQSLLGLRLAYYFSKHDGFGNHVFELSPSLSSALHDEPLTAYGPTLHGIVSVTAGYWRQFRTFNDELLLHEDLFFDGSMGLEFVFPNQVWGALQLNTLLLFREFRLSSTYYRIELMYTYSI